MGLLGGSCRLARAAAFVLSWALACSAGALGRKQAQHRLYPGRRPGMEGRGFHGGTIRTPNLDRLAANGAVLNAFYCQPFSAQTRAALMTGRYPMRYGLQTATIMPSSQFGLPADERTLAQALKEAGYGTRRSSASGSSVTPSRNSWPTSARVRLLLWFLVGSRRPRPQTTSQGRLARATNSR